MCCRVGGTPLLAARFDDVVEATRAQSPRAVAPRSGRERWTRAADPLRGPSDGRTSCPRASVSPRKFAFCSRTCVRKH